MYMISSVNALDMDIIYRRMIWSLLNVEQFVEWECIRKTQKTPPAFHISHYLHWNPIQYFAMKESSPTRVTDANLVVLYVIFRVVFT
jgi:hypothetical protein